MNKEFFDAICNFAGLLRSVGGDFVESDSGLLFHLENDGIYIRGKMDIELLGKIRDSVLQQLSDDREILFINDGEIKLNFPTIINSLNLWQIIVIIRDYYNDIMEKDVKNYYHKVYERKGK